MLFLCAGMVFFAGCKMNYFISREELLAMLPGICKNRYQTHVTCKAINNTLWVYLPYTSGRRGFGETEIKDNNALYVDYAIASFNPFRILNPPELRYVSQRIVREIRNLELRCRQPYTFFVLVVTNIDNSSNKMDEYYIGYIDDLKYHQVGVDFSGEGFSRLAWDEEEVGFVGPEGEAKVAASFQDKEGTHVKYHDVTMKEFIEKQIKWRIYKRFTIEYSSVPFDLTDQEKEDAIKAIVKKVIMAYNLDEIEKLYLSDSLSFKLKKTFLEHPMQEIKHHGTEEVTRKPSF